MTVLYLHGFASGAGSTKARYFRDRFRERGVTFDALDLDAPDFTSMTMTRSLEQIAGAVARAGDPVALIGSSLGGTLAILAADRLSDRISRVVLLAPAVMFAKPGHHLLEPGRLEEWRRRGTLSFFHYALGEERPLRYAFYEDSLQYDAFGARLVQPALVFQGIRDASVDCRTVERFALARPNVTLSLLDDDHQLTASLPRIWEDVEPFLLAAPSR
ncbi:MAG: alpha/beta fold hydrolase [Acidobacteria bacterium]|nr:alpha/beta fold hydrolase [Acidobacteriota bacterium]